MFTGSPSKGHISFPTKRTRVRKELEAGERGKMGCSGQDRNEQPGKIKTWRKERKRRKLREDTVGRRQCQPVSEEKHRKEPWGQLKDGHQPGCRT